MYNNREIIQEIISSKYNKEGMEDRKKRLVNLFFTNIITNQEYKEVIDMINDISNSMRKNLDFINGYGNIGDYNNRKKMIEEADEEQLEAYVKFNTNIRKHFDFRIGSEQSKLNFRMGPQKSYMYVLIDHRIYNKDINKYITYNDNRNHKTGEYKPTVYINQNRKIFKNFLNWMKETDLLEDFIFTFEEKTLLVI